MTDKATEKATKKRGADPLDAIPYPEVRAFFQIERAFDGLDDDATRRLTSLIIDKYGPKPILIPNL